MGLEGGLGMGLLASTFDVESVVFPMRGSHFLAFYGAGGYWMYDNGYWKVWYSLGGAHFLWGWREALGRACWSQLSMFNVWFSLGEEQKKNINDTALMGKNMLGGERCRGSWGPPSLSYTDTSCTHRYVILDIGYWKVWYSLVGAHFLWGWREALGRAC